MNNSFETSQTLVDQFDYLMLDLDGVCYLGAQPVPYAIETLDRLSSNGLGLFYITNNSSRVPSSVSEQLTGLGLNTNPDQILTSAQATAQRIAAIYPRGSIVLALGGEGVFEALQSVGMKVVTTADGDPVAVVQGWSREIGWVQLSEAVLAIKNGARHFATNLDATLPTERGETIGNGSFVAAVCNATGQPALSSGKPEDFIYEAAQKLTGSVRPLAIGDRLDTDIRGANAAGIPSMHVLTGVGRANDVLFAKETDRPRFLAADLRDLTTPYPNIVCDDGVVKCGDDVASVAGGIIFLNGEKLDTSCDTDHVEVSLNSYRALAHLVWTINDSSTEENNLVLPRIEVIH